MAFDFPASPTTGTVSNGYTFDGVGWAGGPGVSGPVTEQWFDLGAKTSLDVAVPSWAKGVQISGVAYMTVANGMWLRISMDGSTFISTADYVMYGPQMHSGSSAYQAWGSGAQNGFSLAQVGDVIAQPTQFQAELGLVRPSVNENFAFMTRGRALDATAAAQSRTWLASGAMNVAAVNPNLAIKALRFMAQDGTSAFKAGSWVKVAWIGDSAAIPQSNAITAPPSDGNEYTMVNGVWRLKEQLIDLSGKTEMIIDVPSWSKIAVFEGALWPGSTVNYTLMSVSTDGVSFYGNVHQLVGGPYHKTTGGYLTQTAVAAAGFYLTMPSSNLNVPHFFNATVNLETGLSNQIISFRAEFSNFDNTAQGQQYVWQGYLNAAPSPSPGRAKKLRIFAQAATAFAATSFAKVRWL